MTIFILSSYVEGHLQKNSILSFVFGWFQGIRNLGGFLENLLIFQAEIIPLSPLFFDFLTFFHMVLKNQKNCKS